MKKNSNAFVLVKSLSMSEKRYFKIFSERHIIGSQNKYVALFDQLDKATIEEDAFFIQNLKKAGMNADFIGFNNTVLTADVAIPNATLSHALLINFVC